MCKYRHPFLASELEDRPAARGTQEEELNMFKRLIGYSMKHHFHEDGHPHKHKHVRLFERKFAEAEANTSFRHSSLSLSAFPPHPFTPPFSPPFPSSSNSRDVSSGDLIVIPGNQVVPFAFEWHQGHGLREELQSTCLPEAWDDKKCKKMVFAKGV